MYIISVIGILLKENNLDDSAEEKIEQNTY